MGSSDLQAEALVLFRSLQVGPQRMPLGTAVTFTNMISCQLAAVKGGGYCKGSCCPFDALSRSVLWRVHRFRLGTWRLEAKLWIDILKGRVPIVDYLVASRATRRPMPWAFGRLFLTAPAALPPKSRCPALKARGTSGSSRRLPCAGPPDPAPCRARKISGESRAPRTWAAPKLAVTG